MRIRGPKCACRLGGRRRCRREQAARRRRALRVARRRWWLIAAGVGAETGGLWVRSHRLGGRVVVRCRSGHVFTTIWIPGASLKSLRLGWWRFQRCPVGGHWAWVTPVRESELSDAERRSALEHRDLPIP